MKIIIGLRIKLYSLYKAWILRVEIAIDDPCTKYQRLLDEII